VAFGKRRLVVKKRTAGANKSFEATIFFEKIARKKVIIL
jgi:hypothetical protein